jgi:hypothetical protein
MMAYRTTGWHHPVIFVPSSCEYKYKYNIIIYKYIYPAVYNYNDDNEIV